MRLFFRLLCFLIATGVVHAQRFQRSVNTLADLIAENPNNQMTNVWVASYATANDGGGGIWTWVRGDTTAADGGTAVESTHPLAPVGRYIRQFEGAANPLWFGATPNDATDDTVALQATLNRGRGMFVPDGVFFATTIMPPSGSHIFGWSTNAVIKKLNGSTEHLISNYLQPAVNNILIENIQLDGNKANSTQGTLIRLGGNNITVRNCYLHDAPNCGVELTFYPGCGNYRILNNYVKNCSLVGSNFGGIAWSGGNGVLVHGNQIETTDASHAYGIDGEPNPGTTSADNSGVIVTDNWIKGGTLQIDYANVTGVVSNVVVANNIVDRRGAANPGPGFDFGVLFLRNFSSFKVTGNICYQHESVTSPTGGVYCWGLGDGEISGNTFYLKDYGSTTQRGIFFNSVSPSHDILIAFNQFISLSGTIDFGIWMDAPNALTNGYYKNNIGTGIDTLQIAGGVSVHDWQVDSQFTNVWARALWATNLLVRERLGVGQALAPTYLIEAKSPVGSPGYIVVDSSETDTLSGDAGFRIHENGVVRWYLYNSASGGDPFELRNQSAQVVLALGQSDLPSNGEVLTWVTANARAEWLPSGGGGGGGTPGGSDTQLQFNNATVFGGAAAGTYSIANLKFTLDRLSVPYSLERGVTNATGAAIDFDLRGEPVLQTTNNVNQVITLLTPQTGDYGSWLVRLTGSGANTLSFVAPAGHSLTARWGTFATTPRAGLTEYFFEKFGTEIFFDTTSPLALADLPSIATDRLLGRDTAASGVPEELTVGGGLGFTGSGGIEIADNGVTGAKIAFGSDAQGDVAFYNGTDWARLAAGASGLFLKTQGAGANPIWDTPIGGGGSGGGNMVNTGANAVGTVPRASDTSATNYVPSLMLVAPTTGNMTLGDDTQATITRVTRVTGTDITENISNAGISLGATTAGYTAGFMSAAGATAGPITAGAQGRLELSGSSRFTTLTNQYWTMTGSAGTNFFGLKWGPSTNSIMWLKTNNTFMATMGNDEFTLVPIIVSDVTLGSTGSVAGAISGKQPIDADLTEIASLTGTGLLSRVGANDYEERTITAGSNMVAVNGNGVAGNPTLSVATTPTFTNVTSVASNPYGAGWDESLLVPNENDLYDIISTLSGGGAPGGSDTQVQFNDGGAFGGDAGMTYVKATDALTIAGRLTLSGNSAASTPMGSMTGTWFTGGTATTTKPHFLIEPTGTTSTAWSTAGTGLGINAASGFTGSVFDAQIAGASKFSVTSAIVQAAGTSLLGLSGRIYFYSPSSGTLGIENGAGSGLTKVILGIDDASPDANVTVQSSSGVGSNIGSSDATFASGATTGNSVLRGNPKIAFPTFSTASSSTANALATSLSLGGTLKVDTTTTGNVGAGEDDLISYTIPAAQLSKDGDYFEFDVFGTFAANANSAQVKIYWDGLAFFDSTSLIFNGLTWKATGKIIRTSATTVKIQGDFGISGTLLGALTTTTRYYSTDTSTLTGTIVFKVTGTDTGGVPADNKVIQEGLVLRQFLGQ